MYIKPLFLNFEEMNKSVTVQQDTATGLLSVRCVETKGELFFSESYRGKTLRTLSWKFQTALKQPLEKCRSTVDVHF